MIKPITAIEGADETRPLPYEALQVFADGPLTLTRAEYDKIYEAWAVSRGYRSS